MRRAVLFAAGAAVAAGKVNPIRRVITLLQEMSAEISAEVEKEKKMYEKFDCYCKKNNGDLTQKAQLAAETIKAEEAAVEGNQALKKQLGEEIKTHKKDRAKAEKDLEEATTKRNEEKAKYDEATREHRKTLEDLDKAVAALEKGMGKSFLQTNAAGYLERILSSNSASMAGLSMNDQMTVSAFLQNKGDYHSQGGEIVGILKMMKSNFDEALGGAISEEEAAVKSFAEVKGSLQDLISTSGASIEKKSETKGQTAVKIVEGKNLVSTTRKQMDDDMATLMELKKSCANKSTEFATRQADAAAEIDAIGQAIGVLDNDDALQLFNKTDTKALNQVSFLQSGKKIYTPASMAFNALQSTKFDQPAIALLAFAAKQALKSGQKKVDFSKIIKMIDDMVVLLKKEADDDLASRDNCNSSLNQSTADKKEAEHAIEGLQAKIEELASAIEQQKTIIAKAGEDIAAANQAAAEATEQRKAENGEWVVANNLNEQAVGLIKQAKNKLNAFYNPQMHKEDKEELTEEEEIFKRASGADLLQTKEAPETWDGAARANKGKKSNSVMALMDMVSNDLEKDTQAMRQNEQVAQRDYEKLSSDLAAQVVESNKAAAESTATKASAEEAKLTAESSSSMKSEELNDINRTISDLHNQCDFILQAFEERKSARETEINGLTKAKAILSGAKFDL